MQITTADEVLKTIRDTNDDSYSQEEQPTYNVSILYDMLGQLELDTDYPEHRNPA